MDVISTDIKATKRHFIIVILGMLISLVTCAITVKHISTKNVEQETTTIATIISNNISDEFLQLITVTDTLSKNKHIIDALKSEDAITPDAAKVPIINELEYYLKGSGYNQIYLISEKTKVYYTYNGIVKVIQPEIDPSDVWYSNFIGMNKVYDLNVDTDEANDWELSVFVNHEIRDENNNFLGACGVGVDIDSIRQLMLSMEQEYDIKIRLVDKDGVVQVATDSQEILSAIREHGYFDKVNREKIYYEEMDNVSRATRFIDNMDWYLVIENNNPVAILAWDVVGPIVVVYILTILFMFYEMKIGNDESELRGKKRSLSSLSDIYVSMHLIDIDNAVAKNIRIAKHLEIYYAADDITQEQINAAFNETVVAEHVDRVLEFVNIQTLKSRMNGKRSICCDFLGKTVGWCRARFIVEGDDLQEYNKAIFAVEDINEYKRQEEKIFRQSIYDDLTKCYNRKAYEYDLADKSVVPTVDNFVCISADINGLKIVNDELGHIAGDELIAGAAMCLNKCLSAYGKVYRTGGDEFIAIIYADADRLEFIKEDIENTVNIWSGSLVDRLVLSCGYAGCNEFPDITIEALIDIADKRMYDVKSKYYQNKGLDKRGMQAAYSAIRQSYIKILKLDLTADSFIAIQLNSSEADESKGYDGRFSYWIKNFAEAGQVHPDDMESFVDKLEISNLRKYFSEQKRDFVYIYRRIYGNEYIRVLMEMIPAKEYTNQRQIVYLYVKNLSEERHNYTGMPVNSEYMAGVNLPD